MPKRSNSVIEAWETTATIAKIQSRMGTIKSISSQFTEDVNVIIEKCGNKGFLVMMLFETVSEPFK